MGTFVNISTDKAARPTSVLGWSKRIAERLTAAADADERDARYISVRFGNVLGSRGSVVVAFTEQIRAGGPVTVTHPDVERYFMLIPEACQLVLQAGTIGAGGEVMVLEMGSPVKIVDVARTMIHMSGQPDVADRLHRPPPRREAQRGAVHPGRGGAPARATRSSRRSRCPPSTPTTSTCPSAATTSVRAWLVAYSGAGPVSSRP